MSQDMAAYIRAQTALATPSIVPEITLHMAVELTPLWLSTEERLKQAGLPPPFWAFAWPGGQALARYILDHPCEAKDKRILDFAAGGGVAAIAAAKVGAAKSIAADIDPFALVAIQMNATRNGVVVENAREIDMEKAYLDADLILAGDVCYQQAMSVRIMRWLYLCLEKGVRILLADPGRAYVPQSGLVKLAQYDVPTSRELEDRDSRTVTIWEVQKPD